MAGRVIKKITHHHLIPGSRCAELGIIDKNDGRNLRSIDDVSHQAWHALFFNLSPYEVVQMVYALHQEQFFWIRDRKEWTIIFGTMGLLEACEEVVRNWTPRRSFYIPDPNSGTSNFRNFLVPLVAKYL